MAGGSMAIGKRNDVQITTFKSLTVVGKNSSPPHVSPVTSFRGREVVWKGIWFVSSAIQALNSSQGSRHIHHLVETTLHERPWTCAADPALSLASPARAVAGKF